MAISFVGAASSVSDDDNDLFAIFKPSGVQAGDFMIAAVSSYAGPNGSKVSVTPPSGWVTVANFAVTGNKPHQLTIMTRTAVAGDPGSWFGTYGSNQELESELCVAYRGVAGLADTDIATKGSGTSYNTGTVTNSASNNWRVTIAGYTAGTLSYEIDSNEVSERVIRGILGDGQGGVGNESLEAGIWDSNGTVSVSNHSRTISRDATWTTSCAWIAILDASDITVSGSMEGSLFLPSVSLAVTQAVPGTLGVSLPQMAVSATGIASPPSGGLEFPVTPVVSIAAATAAVGTVDTVIEPDVDIVGETRKFGPRVITPEAESRVITPLLGVDTLPVRGFLVEQPAASEPVGGDIFVVRMPVPEVSAGVDISPASVFAVTMPLPAVSISGGGDAVYVADYATPQLAANDAANKHLIFPSGQTYIVNELLIPTGCYIDGNNSTLKTADGTTSSGTSDAMLRVNGSNVTIDNLNLDGNIQNQGGIWSQHRHAIRIHGNFSNVIVKNCDFVNLIGDGVYANVGGGGNNGSNIEIHTCTFTGANDNRNGVSLISGTDMHVHDCTFTGMANDAMPGAVDLEPNSPSDICADILIENNTISRGATNGNAGGVVLAMVQGCVGTNIVVQGNDISGAGMVFGVQVVGVNGGPFNASAISVTGNTIHDIGWNGVELDYWIGASVTNNAFTTIANNAIENYFACLGSTSGNSYSGIGNLNVKSTSPQCS